MKTGKRLKNNITAAVAIVFLYVAFDVLGIGCPIKFLTGISCIGCGMTRAWLSVLRLDWKSAFYYHPAFWLPPLFLIFFLFKNKISIKIYKIFIFTAISLFVIIYIARLLQADGDIVVFQPQNNILFRISKMILNYEEAFYDL